MILFAPSASYTPLRCLHGKSLPSAARGLLLRVEAPYGFGWDSFIWAFVEEKKMMVAAMAVILIEGMTMVVLFVPDEEF